MRRARSSPATTRPISASTARSIPIAAASMAASIASRGRATPISACRPASISRAASSTSRRRRRCSRAELRKKGYACRPIALGTNTDPYQPVERRLGVTRSILEVLRDFRHPVTIVTKSALIRRDIDILAEMAKDRLAIVTISVTTLDRGLARVMEPRAATPERRLETIAALADAGIPTGVLERADDPGAQRQRDGADPRTGARRRRRFGRLYPAAPAARAEGAVPRMAREAISRTRRRMCCRWSRRPMAAGSTIRLGRSG